MFITLTYILTLFQYIHRKGKKSVYLQVFVFVYFYKFFSGGFYVSFFELVKKKNLTSSDGLRSRFWEVLPPFLFSFFSLLYTPGVLLVPLLAY